MRSPSLVAVAVRRPDGSLAYFDRAYRSVTLRVKALGLPIVRGAVALFETLYLGMTALNFSADEAGRDEGGTAAKASAGQSVIQGATLVFSLAVGLLLFVVLPARLTVAVGATSRLAFGLVDGAFRLAVFLLYLFLISQWKEMARVLGYHGAEHKAIHALEARAPLTPESVQTFSRFHPRCGTTFLFIVVVVSIVVFTLIGRPQRIQDHLLRIACMPLIAGLAFEFIRLSGKHQAKAWVRALSWPGIQFQRLTTREPDLTMCAVAIAALEHVRADETVRRLEAAGDGAPLELTFVQ